MPEQLHDLIITVTGFIVCGIPIIAGALFVFVKLFDILGSIGDKDPPDHEAMVPDLPAVNYGALPGEDLAWMGLPFPPRPGNRVTGPLAPRA